jgi:spore coat polysaccharide biosynthesis protein SpsF
MVYAIIQARVGSSRLYGKVLMELNGKSILLNVIQRVKSSHLVDEVMVVTTDLKEDFRIVEECKVHGIKCFQGSETDVLDRFYQASKWTGMTERDTIVRITADCPFMDSKVIDLVISFYLSEHVDYASNVDPPTFPDGLDVEVFRYNALVKAWNEASLFSEREHVTPYIRKNSRIFRSANLECKEDLSMYRFTVDEPEDYEFVKKIYHMLNMKKWHSDLGEDC